MSWQITIGANGAFPFSALGCSKLRREIRSQAAGTFSFTETASQMDAPALGSNLEECTVQWVPGNETGYVEPINYFQGRLTSIPRAGAPANEERRYVISDPWVDFERVTYQQQWNVINGKDESGSPTTAGEYRSECLLGIDIKGNLMNSDAAITDVVNWAIARGANVQLGTILKDSLGSSTAAPVPVKEISDLPCSSVIQELLRLTPDAVTWFDYTTTPPTFNVTRRGNCTPVSVEFSGAPEDIELSPRWDLVRSQVVIRYVQENQTDGLPATTTIVDAAPGGADGLGFDAMVATVRLAGSNTTFQKQPVQTAPIPNDGTDSGAVAWWQAHVPWLQQFSADRLTIEGVAGSVDPGQLDSNGDGDSIEDDIAKYPRELISGAVSGWMNCYVARTTWTANVSYSYPDTTDTESQKALTVFGADSDANHLEIAAQITATSAVTQTYAQLSSYTSPEPVPAGLAAALYSALSVLHYDGSYTLVQNEVGLNRLGIVLNITGSQQPWGAMNALVQEITDELDEGRTIWKVGPPRHLTIQDLMEQLRYTRTRVPSGHIKERESGQPGDAPTVDGPGSMPLNGNATTPIASSSYPWIGSIVDHSDDESNQPDTYDAVVGYGVSSFAGSNPTPLEKLEIDVGNDGGMDGSSWSSPDGFVSATDLYNTFSLISGDDTEINDQLLIGRTNSDGAGGSIILTPFEPCVVLSPNLDGSYEPESDQYIKISLPDSQIEIQDLAGSTINAVINGSGAPSIELINANTGNYCKLDEYALTLDQPGDGMMEIGGDFMEVSITLETGSFAYLGGGSLSLYDSYSTDTAILQGNFLQMTDSEGGSAFLDTSLLQIADGNGSTSLLYTSKLEIYGAGQVIIDASATNSMEVSLMLVPDWVDPTNNRYVLCSAPIPPPK